MKFSIHTLGCKVNQSDSQNIEALLLSRGHIICSVGDGCDVSIINTCAVTGESARKSRQAVRRIKKGEPNAMIVVCGCFSQIDPESVAALDVDLVWGSGDREKLVFEIESLIMSESEPNKSELSNLEFNESDLGIFEPATPYSEIQSRTRAFLKIQDGCDNYCAYCIIPYARGAPRSLPLLEAIEQAKLLEKNGYREIVLIGIELSSYGKELPNKISLLNAIEEISEAVPTTRIRIGSLDPNTLSDDFIGELAKSKNLCNHFHISLQSGCDETLQRMGRKYDTKTVSTAISQMRSVFPNCGVTADLITGFPGETDEEFAQTLRFIQQIGFSAMHIFPFSPRKGTPAATMPNQVSKAIRQERAKIVSTVAKEMTQAFLQKQIGTTAKVLFEQESKGNWQGYSTNYIEITAKGETKKGEIHPVVIERVENGKAHGIINN
ncbi:MAG: tRNA (N(6)-L-threonylcarbamoyladenosine(37)-C(2))-methylthiotransferase MtaB [Oscillospiraceae bacterium]|nr:tRNA (N(6)-L-threonylcarbamoyladenosine(37)-C(2))-methylthiotransferase MtaB [Oscillospiraceae bacterium]